ncbi:MerR family transcriptional regulator [Enterococcus sp. DIV1298c]|uniref:MerR family transcriptional regulator n=1 Tax=Enterococcus sp. DIV1298c TaxID=2815328 RepID=UPI001A9280A1|nr:MerR family transcriptional regulator [Enterococcus sp. DIV1298c]MBO0460177.1 MerR family transcriptional regulator [Enterococcus sp. DIV1298c]
MEYTIKKMAQLSGVSSRTLRFYDEIDLLKPKRINSAGYRIYGSNEIDRLQQILFYRSLDFPLNQIRELLDEPTFDHQRALIDHQRKLLEKRAEIDTLLATVQQTLAQYDGGKKMTDQEKFEGFKKQKLTENETNYGKEIREKYGEGTIDKANEQWQNMSQEVYQEMQAVEQRLLSDLTTYLSDKSNQALAKEIFDAHKKWLLFSWPTYQTEAHKGLGTLYISDERFAEYYDSRSGKGAAEALNEIIQANA